MSNQNKLSPDDVDTIFFHYSCIDGFTAAFACWYYMSLKHPERKIDYYPVSIGMPPPENIEGKNVLVADFSFSLPIIQDLLKKVKSLLIIDHHKSAEKALAALDDKYKIFDMNHSGAYLTWVYFFGENNVPELIKYVEDRDIWLKRMPNTDEFADWISTIIGPPMPDFSILLPYLDNDKLHQVIEQKGKSYRELNNYYINLSATNATVKFMSLASPNLRGKYYLIAYKNVSYNAIKSDVGNKLMFEYPEIDFSAVYSLNDSDSSTSFSLRSTDDHCDVSEIATALGGGGHRNASGVWAAHPTTTLPGTVYDLDIYSLLKKSYAGKLKVNDQDYNVVYCYAPKNKRKLASYLLQDRTNTKQVGQAFVANDSVYDLSAAFSYDPINDETTYVVDFYKTITPLEKEKIVAFLKLDVDRKVKFKGCRKYLTINS